MHRGKIYLLGVFTPTLSKLLETIFSEFVFFIASIYTYNNKSTPDYFNLSFPGLNTSKEKDVSSTS